MTHRLEEVLSRQDPRFLSHSYDWEKWEKPSSVSRRDGLQSCGVSVSTGLPWCSYGISCKRKTHALLAGNAFSCVLADKKDADSLSVVVTKELELFSGFWVTWCGMSALHVIHHCLAYSQPRSRQHQHRLWMSVCFGTMVQGVQGFQIGSRSPAWSLRVQEPWGY